MQLTYVDQGCTGEQAYEAATSASMQLQVVKLPEAKCGFVLPPRKWVVERNFGWSTRFQRLVRDYERLLQTLAGPHFIAFA